MPRVRSACGAASPTTTNLSLTGSTHRRKPSPISGIAPLRHHAHGVFEAERLFGHAIVNSDGRTVPVRYIAEQHIKEDCGGRIPTVADWLSRLNPSPWMSRGYRIEASADTHAEQAVQS